MQEKLEWRFKMKDYTDYFDQTKGLRVRGKMDMNIYILCREIHEKLGAPTPCEWIHKQIYYAFDALKHCETESDFENQRSSIEGNFYDYTAMRWGLEPYAREYINENFHLHRGKFDIAQICRIGQIMAIVDIYESVWEFIKQNEVSE